MAYVLPLCLPFQFGLPADRPYKAVLGALRERKCALQVFKHEFFKDSLPDVVSEACAGVAAVVRADEEILTGLEMVGGAVVELPAAVGAIDEPLSLIHISKHGEDNGNDEADNTAYKACRRHTVLPCRFIFLVQRIKNDAQNIKDESRIRRPA